MSTKDTGVRVNSFGTRSAMESFEDATEKGYITLKEAAQLSNYSSDYIGQLIRSGKLEGKQVYSNIAWVTTEEALYNYIENKGKNTASAQGRGTVDVVEIMHSSYFKRLLQALIVVAVVIFLFAFYIFSIGIDRALHSAGAEGGERNEASTFMYQ